MTNCGLPIGDLPRLSLEPVPLALAPRHLRTVVLASAESEALRSQNHGKPPPHKVPQHTTEAGNGIFEVGRSDDPQEGLAGSTGGPKRKGHDEQRAERSASDPIPDRASWNGIAHTTASRSGHLDQGLDTSQPAAGLARGGRRPEGRPSTAGKISCARDT